MAVSRLRVVVVVEEGKPETHNGQAFMIVRHSPSLFRLDRSCIPGWRVHRPVVGLILLDEDDDAFIILLKRS